MNCLIRPFAFAAAVVFMAGCVSQSPSAPPVSVERGKYVVQAVTACALCHVQRGPQGQPLELGLSGGTVIRGAGYQAVAANITPDPETGIGKWSEAQIARAIREGVRPDGTLIGPAMPVAHYRGLSDSDVRSVAAYLKSQPAVSHAVAKSRYDKPLPADYGPAPGMVTAPSPADRVAYGKYLVGVAFCLECHTRRDAAGKEDMAALGAGGLVIPGPWGQSISRNLTPHATGLRDWTDADIEHTLRTGTDRSGHAYKPPMPFSAYKNLTGEDMAAIISFLRTLEPVPMGGR